MTTLPGIHVDSNNFLHYLPETYSHYTPGGTGVPDLPGSYSRYTGQLLTIYRAANIKKKYPVYRECTVHVCTVMSCTATRAGGRLTKVEVNKPQSKSG